jgi:hypothetical protein
MDLQKLTAAFDAFCGRVGPGLIASDVWGAEMLSLASYNSQPAAVALFGDITSKMKTALRDSGFPSLGRYYLIELSDKKVMLVMVYKDFQCGSLVDMTKVNMGTLLSIAVAKAIDEFQAAVDG